MRLPVLLLVTAALAAGCGSGSGAGTRTRAPTPTAEPSSPASSPAPSTGPVPSPTATATPVHRKVPRPPGAHEPDLDACLVSNTVILAIEGDIWAAGDRAGQMQAMAALGRLAGDEKADVTKKRRLWLAAGWPASSPIVRDLDGFISVYTQLQKAGQAGNVEAVPQLYLRLTTLDGQLNDDLDSAGVCQ